jgi:hypothetical protein
MIVRCRGAAPGSGTAPERTTRHCQDDAPMSRLTVAYHHGDLPTALLAAVESAVADGGVSGVSLRDVARRAGVSHGAPAGLPAEALAPDIAFASAGSVEGRGNLLGE